MTDRKLFELVLKLIKAKEIDGHSIDIRTKEISAEAVKNRIYAISRKNLKIDDDFKSNTPVNSIPFPKRVWRNPKQNKGDALAVACSVDPLCYVSHLSAMQIYGLTNRNSQELMITVAGRNAWKELITKLPIPDFDTDDINIPFLRISLPKNIRNRQIHVFKTENIFYPAVTQEDEISRIVPIGRCFIDMLSEPWLCGGVAHILEIFSQHGKVFKNEIIEAGEKDTRPIVKVRLGYVMNEYLGYEDARIEKWLAFAQRGSSRKLDPKQPFDGTRISEKWMLSLNV